MNDNIFNSHDTLLPRESDPHGQAAIILVESLIHGLIARKVLNVAEAVEIVDVATEVRMECGIEKGEPTQILQASINLLQDISASLRVDLRGNVERGAPI